MIRLSVLILIGTPYLITAPLEVIFVYNRPYSNERPY